MAVLSLDNDADSHRSSKQVTVLAGATSDIFIVGVEKPTISVFPGAGGTAKAQVSISPLSDIRIEAASVNWIDWALGDVAVDSSDVPLGVINAVRFMATTQDAVCEVAG